MSDKTPKLRPACDVDLEESLRTYFDSLPSEARILDRGMTDIISTIWHRSVDAAWPSALKLARALGKESGPSVVGWTFRSVSDGNPWHVSFVAEFAGSGSGFLFTCVLEKERSETAKAKQAAQTAEIMALSDPEERKKAFARLAIDKMKEGKKVKTADPDSYKNPAEVSRVSKFSVHAIHGERPPAFYDDDASPLDELLESVADNGYANGLIACCRPTDDMMRDIILPTDKCSETAATLLALSVLEKGLVQANLMDEVRERGHKIATWAYDHYGNARSALLVEAAQCAVYLDSGFSGPHSFETVWEFWKDATAYDLSIIAEDIAETAAMLRDRGHISEDTAYDCNDLNDSAYVAPLSNGVSTIWLKTQNGTYGILFRADEAGMIDHFSFAREGWCKAASEISPDVAGFLGAFNASETDSGGRRKFHASMMGGFSDLSIRGLNNILLTLSSVHCCLEEDVKDSARP